MKYTLGALVLLALGAAPAAGSSGTEVVASTANPIRKVVTMLQMMQNKVAAEAAKEQELFDKYMCWCKTGSGDLGKSIGDANVKVPQLQSDIEEAEAALVQLKADVAAAQTGRAAANEAMKAATAIREKEAAAAAAEIAEFKSFVTALSGAIAAIDKGMAGSFLQTTYGSMIRKIVLTNAKILDADRQDIMAFLSDGQQGGFVPQSGEISGILKTMKDEFDADLASATKAEADAVASYEALMAAKKKEVEVLSKEIETKLGRIGETGVKIAEMKNDLTDTEEQLVENQKFLKELKSDCETKGKEWQAIVATRADELVALAETIKILNDDDALELFKKTLPSASLLQVAESKDAVRRRALEVVQAMRQKKGGAQPQLDLISLALRGKQAGFEKVLKMIDDLVATLKKEQVDDESKKEYCEVQLDTTDDKRKAVEKDISDLEAGIAADEESLAALATEIEALQDGIKALDKAVVEATDMRKKENEDFVELMADDSTAKELILFAKNRLNKFYNPKLYKPAPKRELSEEERITTNMGGTLAPTNPPGGIAGTGISLAQVKEHHQSKQAPPPPPEAVGAYKKKGEESGGVIAMMDLIVKDLDKEMQEAKVQEEDAQKDYEKLMRDSAEKRADDSKSLTDKSAAKADTETNLVEKKEGKAASTKELLAVGDYIASLHAECDWLLKYFDIRKEARASEIDSLGKAKAVLSGADFSLLQRKEASSRPLRLRRGQ